MRKKAGDSKGKLEFRKATLRALDDATLARVPGARADQQLRNSRYCTAGLA